MINTYIFYISLLSPASLENPNRSSQVEYTTILFIK